MNPDTYIWLNGHAVPADIVFRDTPDDGVTVTTVNHGSLYETCIVGGPRNGYCRRVYTSADGANQHVDAVKLALGFNEPVETGWQVALEFLGACLLIGLSIAASGVLCTALWMWSQK